MKTIRSFTQLKRLCALITLFTFLFELVLPALLPGLSSRAVAAEGDDGSAGSANYYQQELEKFGKGTYHAGESGVMTYRYPLGGGISANYTSESGWSVGGHSRIARSTKWGVPEYSDDDIFTLNGQELVKSDEYNTLPFCDEGATQTVVYHTENENYQRILYCKPGQSDSYWKIYNQDGSWSTYGSTADSRIEAIGQSADQPRAWAIAESRDKGDYHVTTYAYTEDSTNGSYYLDKIVSGKTGAAADGYKATLIAYETRPDQRTSHRSGAKVKSTKRVTSVVHVIGCDNTGAGGNPVNGYKIAWTASPQTNQSIITSITPYGSDLTVDGNGDIAGGSSLPATTFDYHAYEGGFESTNESWTGDTAAYPLRYTTTPEEEPVAFAPTDGNEDEFKQAAAPKMAKLHIPFIENKGQTDEAVRYYAQTFGGTVFVTEKGEIIYNLPKTGPVEPESIETPAKEAPLNEGQTKASRLVGGVALKETFVGGRAEYVTGEEEAVTTVSYFAGKDESQWKSEIPTYNFVTFGEVYEGIELTLRAYGDNVEKLFTVQPGVDPANIRLKVEGGNAIDVNTSGELAVTTDLGAIQFTKPVAYQYGKDGNKQYVEVAYHVEGDTYGFEVGEYDETQEVIIDPLLASTFLGGNGNDMGSSLTVDTSGNVYVTGCTVSADYPTTTGAYDTTQNGAFDILLAMLNSELTTLLASTFLGGSSDDCGYSLAIDASGSVYVTGYTSSADYPTTAGAYDTTQNGAWDVMLAKLDSGLTTLLASTLLGGSDYDHGYSLALDASGNVYVTGYTSSADYPTTAGAYDTTSNGYSDVLLAKLDSGLTTLLASTLLGGSNSEEGRSLALDASGSVYVTGETYSANYPTTAGAYDTTSDGNSDVLLAKLDSGLTTLLASTFLGGSKGDGGGGSSPRCQRERVCDWVYFFNRLSHDRRGV